MRCKPGRTQWNLARAESLIERASASFIKDRTVVCLPELFATGYDLTRQEFQELAEAIPGPTAKRLAAWAKRFKAYVCGGIAEKGRPGTVYDTSVLVSPSGKLLGSYRKIHLAGDHEKSIFTPGNGVTVARTKLGGMGLSICYDQVFPELTRKLAFGGADIILHSSAWSSFPREMDWGPREYGIFSIARAMENCVFVVSSDQTGSEGSFRFVGRTRVVAPWGKVLAARERGEGYAIARTNLDVLQLSRSVHPCLQEEARAVYQQS